MSYVFVELTIYQFTRISLIKFVEIKQAKMKNQTFYGNALIRRVIQGATPDRKSLSLDKHCLSRRGNLRQETRQSETRDEAI